MMWGWSVDAGDWIWMTVMMALVWLPILLLVIWLARSSVSAPRPPSREPEKLTDVARRAYARGELSREQYRQIVADLEGPVHVGRHEGTGAS